MNRARIILLCVVAAITYGVVHDQVTARICIEYFTVAHPPLFPATSPTIVALCWGTAAALPIGLMLGVLLALAAHAGSQEPLAASRLVIPVARLLFLMAMAAFIAGTSGFLLAKHGAIPVPGDFAAVIPAAKQVRFMAVWFAHGASYLVGLVGGGLLVFRVWQQRGRHAMVALVPHSPGAVVRAAIVAAGGAYVLWLRFGGG